MSYQYQYKGTTHCFCTWKCVVPVKTYIIYHNEYSYDFHLKHLSKKIEDNKFDC